MTTIKEFLGIDSFNRKPNGTEMTHQEKYGEIVNAIGLNTLIPYIPAKKHHIVECLKSDEHLNNIPLIKWDNATHCIPWKKAGITSVSLSDGVCLLKEAARMWAESEK